MLTVTVSQSPGSRYLNADPARRLREREKFNMVMFFNVRV